MCLSLGRDGRLTVAAFCCFRSSMKASSPDYSWVSAGGSVCGVGASWRAGDV